MLKSSKIVVVVALVVVCMSIPAFAVTRSWTAGDGNWSDPAKWGGTVPVAGDVAYMTRAATATADSNVGTVSQINAWSSMIIQIDAGASLSVTGGTYGGIQLGMHNNTDPLLASKGTIVQNGGTLNVGGAGVGILYMGTTTGNGEQAEYTMNGGTLNVNRLRMGPSDGILSAVFTQKAGTTVNLGASGLEVGYNSVYNLQGGLLNLNNHGLEARRTGSSFNMTGGTLQGLAGMDWGTSADIHGGVFKVGRDIATASATPIGANSNGNSLTISGGAAEFDVFGASSNDTFDVNGGDTLNLTAGAVAQVNFGAYVPQVSDSWDFVVGAGTKTIAASVSSASADGGYMIGWDTTNWASDGVLTVSSVTIVPEPATMGLLLLGGCAALIRKRK